MAVAADGSATGNVSGGCLEADVREVALRVLELGTPEHREYCGGADEVAAWDLGVGCEGVVNVWVIPVQSGTAAPAPVDDALLAVREFLDGARPFAWCLAFDTGQSLAVCDGRSVGTLGDMDLDAAVRTHAAAMVDSATSGVVTVAGREVFVDVLAPPPSLLVFGRGDDAQILSRLASGVGFRVLTGLDVTTGSVAAHDLAGSAASGVFAVVMSHNYRKDLDTLRLLLESPVEYIGMLGPRQRTERMLAELAADGPLDESRVYGPVGLDIGTDGAEQVAMSIIAEMLAVRSGRGAASLRDRRAPIHAEA